jgi:phosphoribosyl-ATP pyrophosphohydrolase/phosphoribosyl-AMP cyclohydrolase
MTLEDIEAIDFDKSGGRVPAIVQDAATLQVLILAYMNRDALAETLETGEATFFSRSRNSRWRKGESSGNRLRVVEVIKDCDADAVLVRVEPVGPACHLGATSCFGDEDAPGLGRLGRLERTIAARAIDPPNESYTAQLLSKGAKRIAQKLGEEAVETALAGAAGDDAELKEETADLLYHVLVLLRARQIALSEVMDVLALRVGEKR